MPEESMEQKLERIERLARVASEFDADSLEELLLKIKDNDSDVRSLAAARLRNLEDTRAIPGLIELLNDQSPRVRAMAAIGLGHYKAVEARDLLIGRAKADEVGDVRAMCVNSLSDIGGADEVIIQALDDPDWHVKTSAAVVLGRNGTSGAAEKIDKLLDDTNWSVRYFASMALMDLSAVSPRVIDALESLRDIPEALDTLKWFAESDIYFKILEKYPDDIDALEEDVEDALNILRQKHGSKEVPIPPKDPLEKLIAQASIMVGK
ncbi:HEAT repeat domain-containing protein [bacterium]|nr:HEAT repeat domain-containing protein [bacterium]